MKEWERDKKWSDRFIPEIKQILGLHLIGEPPIEEDQKRNTDLMVLKMDAVRVGCRIRKNSYLAKYSDEFTIRAGRPSGAETELTKLLSGWGDYFFYGFCDKTEESLQHWTLCDMKVFRLWFTRKLVADKGKIPGFSKNNNDNSSSFIAFKFSELPESFIVAGTKRVR